VYFITNVRERAKMMRKNNPNHNVWDLVLGI
jgi:hypothetical protein